MSMSPSEFDAAAEATLSSIEAAFDAADIDAECSRSGNVLTVELANRSRLVINSQAAMQQIWVAARSGGFHFAFRDGRWLDTRDGSELFAALSRIASEQAGAPVDLRDG